MNSILVMLPCFVLSVDAQLVRRCRYHICWVWKIGLGVETSDDVTLG